MDRRGREAEVGRGGDVEKIIFLWPAYVLGAIYKRKRIQRRIPRIHPRFRVCLHGESYLLVYILETTIKL